MFKRSIRVAVVLLGAVGGVVASREAAACGGTFCDSGPQPMPVDQTGENVLFVQDGEFLEAHVQIAYTPGATRFAWIVPMPLPPEVRVGSQPLFDAALAGTVPTFLTQFTRDLCSDSECGFGATAGSGGTISAGGGNGGAAGGPFDSGGPTVTSRSIVGSFEVSVLEGGTAAGIDTWLRDNGYETSPDTPRLIQSYVEQRYAFAAIKLTGEASATEIHPLVFRYRGNRPCVPLKLTAVAAAEDMPIRAFFLGEDRVYSSNYKHVELNFARFDWQSPQASYDLLVSRAVDAPVANGRAFVTEFAGASSVIATGLISSTAWQSAAFRSLEPREALPELQRQGLIFCDGFTCALNHPLILGILRRYLPAPQQQDELGYYAGLASSASLPVFDPSRWDGAAFADDLDTFIVLPGARALSAVQRSPFLTRLYTRISPAEMTVDPEFAAHPELNIERVAAARMVTLRTTCDGNTSAVSDALSNPVVLEGGRAPLFSSRMPWAERVIEVPEQGAPLVLVDSRATIDEETRKWNQSRGGPPPAPHVCGGPDAGAGAANGSGGAGTNPGAQTFGGGGCSTGGDVNSAALLGMMSFAMALRLRRRWQRGGR